MTQQESIEQLSKLLTDNPAASTFMINRDVLAAAIGQSTEQPNGNDDGSGDNGED